MLNNFVERNKDIIILVARLLMMTLFLISGWGKLTNYSGTVGYMTSIGVPFPILATLIAIVMEVFVAIALVIGVFTRPLALLMAAFTLGTALLGHHFWTLEGAERAANLINFYKNFSIMGGLMLLAITGPGRYAISHK